MHSPDFFFAVLVAATGSDHAVCQRVELPFNTDGSLLLIGESRLLAALSDVLAQWPSQTRLPSAQS